MLTTNFNTALAKKLTNSLAKVMKQDSVATPPADAPQFVFEPVAQPLPKRLSPGMERYDPRQGVLIPADDIALTPQERPSLWKDATEKIGGGSRHTGRDYVLPYGPEDIMPGIHESPITNDLTRFPLFVKGAGDVDEVSMNDIDQAGLGDCFLLATLGAVALQDPQAIKNMIRENPDGTFTVTFKERIYGTNPPEYSDKPITVSPDFPGFVDGWNHAQPGDANGKGQKEIWPLVIEKAYAQLKGGYDVLHKGDQPINMMETITGRPAKVEPDPNDFQLGGIGKPIGQYNVVNKTFDDVVDDLANGKAVVFGTPAQRKDANGNPVAGETLPFGLVNSHCYVVENTYQDANGRQYLVLYNPWASSHPALVPYDAIYKGNTFSITVS